ncbi:MAG TPA: hypothetical protein ENJ61_06745 [Aquifex aeolicus]|uniref:Polysaccharide chain length determinant N-terminal domain-containing protein n=1 Tax=Aquifex aeolicus TaxID=63363 RepID=A0A7C5LB07_AQUAO|nr:hypothetical protein [Aquifex aeolicus]
MEDRERKPLQEEEEIDLYELWLRLVRRKRLIGGVFLAGVLTALAVSFILKPVYRSEASLLPVASQPTTGLSELAGQFLGIQLSKEGPSAKILALLKSRTLRERVVDKLELVNVLVKDPPPERDARTVAVEILKKMISVTKDRKTGVIKLSVEHEDPALARRIGEALIEELRKALREKALTVARANRVFLEAQLKETEEELKRELRELARFQRREKIIVPEEQLKGTLELYAELLSKKVALQIELRKLEGVLSPDSSRIDYLRRQIEAIDNQLARIENSAEGFSAVPGLENAPEKMAGYTEVLLKVRSLQAKYETLRKLYEQARLEEQREFIYVEIIDPPSEPDVPVKPKRALIVAVAGLSSLMLGIFLALFADWLSAVRERRREGQPDQTGS